MRKREILGYTAAGAVIGGLTMTGVGVVIGVTAIGPKAGGAFALA